MFSCLTVFVVSSVVNAHAGQTLDAKQIMKRCVDEGSVSLFQTLISSEGEDTIGEDWLEITKQIATGDSAWIEVAGCLMYGFHYNETNPHTPSIARALAEALPKNPEAVLFLEHGSISLKEVCSLPFFNIEQAWVDSYIKTTMPILEKLAILQETVDIDHAKICAMRMKEADKRRKEWAYSSP